MPLTQRILHVSTLSVGIASVFVYAAESTSQPAPGCAQNTQTLSLVQHSAGLYEHAEANSGVTARTSAHGQAGQRSAREYVNHRQRASLHSNRYGDKGSAWVSADDMLGELSETDQNKVISSAAPLDEGGYQTVAAMKSPKSMKRFMGRVAGDIGLSLIDKSTMRGVLPYYDGTCARQSYWLLLAELITAQDHYACHDPWATQSNNYDATAGHRKKLIREVKAHVSDSTVEKVVSADDSVKAMVSLVRGIAKELQGQVVHDGRMRNFAEAALGKHWSFQQLVDGMRAAPQEADAWLTLPKSPLSALTSAEHSQQGQKTIKAAWRDYPKNIGTVAPLNDHGYRAVSLVGSDHELRVFFERTEKNDASMAHFIRDMVHELNGTISDEEALVEFARDYSGTQDAKPFWRLLEEVRLFGSQPDSWVYLPPKDDRNASIAGKMKIDDEQATDPDWAIKEGKDGRIRMLNVGSKAPLSEDGYKAVVAAGKNFEMKIFIRRLAKSKGFSVTDEGGLSGFVQYFSGKCAVQDFDRVSSELDDAAWRRKECGGGWLTTDNGI